MAERIFNISNKEEKNMIEPQNIAEYVEKFINIQSMSHIDVKYNAKDDEYLLEGNRKILKFKRFSFEEKTEKELSSAFQKEKWMFEGDRVGTIFFFLSGYWEWQNPQYTDELGRYLGVRSFAYRNGCLRVPVVDILVDTIFKDLDINKQEFYQYPKLCVTHDIDFFKQPQFRSAVRNIVKEKRWKQGGKRLADRLFNRNPFDLGNLLEKELELGLKPICFLLNTIQRQETKGGYLLSHCQKEIEIIQEKSKRGVEFGLHYSTDYLENGKIGNYKEIEKITEKQANFGRAHYLIFDLYSSFEICEKNEIYVDFTSGYRDCIGFRFGTSLPFHPYNFQKKRAYKLWTVPLVLMDGTWISIEEELKRDEKKKEAMQEILQYIDETNGLFTILWHNTSFAYDVWEKYQYWYWDTIQALIKKKYKMINTENILEIEKEEKYWR